MCRDRGKKKIIRNRETTSSKEPLRDFLIVKRLHSLKMTLAGSPGPSVLREQAVGGGVQAKNQSIREHENGVFRSGVLKPTREPISTSTMRRQGKETRRRKGGPRKGDLQNKGGGDENEHETDSAVKWSGSEGPKRDSQSVGRREGCTENSTDLEERGTRTWMRVVGEAREKGEEGAGGLHKKTC